MASDDGQSRTVEVLLAETERLVAIYERVPAIFFDLVVEAGERFRFVSVSNAFLDATGLTRSEVVGRRVDEVIPAASLPLVLGRYRDAIRLNTTISWEETSVYPAGKKVGEVSVTPMVDECDGTTHLVGVVHDVTRRAEAEESLRESEARFRHTLDAMLEGCTIIDHQWRYLYVNEPAARQGGGRTRESLIGRTVAEVHPGVETSGIYEALRRCMEERKPAHFESAFTFPDGTTRWYELRVRPVPEGLFLMSQDVTERRQAAADRERLQRELAQAQRLESVGRLAGGVAHDFNNMLSVILGHAEAAAGKLAHETGIRADLEQIQKAATRSADLTRQLLAFARRQLVVPKVLDLNRTVEGMLTMLRRLLGENITLSWQPAPGALPIEMDPSQVDQILANLCLNARDAIDGVGSITIQTARVELDESFCARHVECVPGSYISLVVRDTGRGMDAATLCRIFEPFFTTKDVGEGTGLGLATVYGNIKQNKGVIEASSQPGQGSAFSVYLPEYAGALPADSVGPTASAVGGDETVLVVEDEPAVVALIEEGLERLGYRVLAADTPTGALRLATAHAGGIDLLLSDVIMPEMSGPELAKLLVADQPRLRVLFTSGYTSDLMARQGLQLGDANFIQKPWTMCNLAAKVREVLDRSANTLSSDREAGVDVRAVGLSRLKPG